uniref:Uncharacterized protein n=1 Tax=uncultured Thiotrichaceae bacterium TaxID=298394 RepID=A0A6S6UK36_9GAMM|nr:MAG: Unknown protein [uncultured Thiotrichaceae bacterium]
MAELEDKKPLIGGIDLGSSTANTADTAKQPMAAKTTHDPEDGCGMSDDPDMDCPDVEEVCEPPKCVYVFISPIPCSTVIINGTVREDGLKRDTFSLTFAPVGEKKPHPIIIDALYTDFGMLVTDDPKVAWVLQESIKKGNAHFFHYNPNDPHHQKFSPEVYAIETPDMMGHTLTLN